MKDKVIKRKQGFQGEQLIVLPKKIRIDFLTRDPITRQIYITDIGYYPKASGHYIKRSHGVNQHILIYCVEGSGWIEIDKKKEGISPSQFFLIPMGTPHTYSAKEDDPWTIYWIHFGGETSSFIVDLILQHVKNYKPYLPYNENRIKLFQDICLTLERGYTMDNLRYVNMIFYHFLSSILYEDKFNYDWNGNKHDVVSSTIDLMQKKLDTRVTLHEFATFAKLSVSYFSAIFHEKTGYSPIEYFNNLKIQKACQYLVLTDMSIKQTSFKLGMDDQYYFSRMFSKLMGMSPKEYRKLNKSG
ncbi:AraC family transcriptional regulator [Chitinophaga sp. 30R24]|uniref:AraC family transcriptional regulator n=1 Tax=Chitinophaga sp. 30R24 TaxID=3248838 RepID=UPI003B8FC301